MKRVICGPRAVSEALRAAPAQINTLFIARSPRPPDDIVELARGAGVELQRCPLEQLDALSGGLRHQGVVAVTGTFSYLDLETLLARAATSREPALLLALDQVQDVGNLGSLVRSAVTMGAHGLILCRHNAAGVTSAVVRTSAGATEHAAIARVRNLAQTLAELRDRDMKVVGMDAQSTAHLAGIDLTGPSVMVLGSEGHGLRRLVRQRCDVIAAIPVPGPIGSLNVGMAGAMAMYEARRQRGSR
jgi:23S rRNA (guanosine2251-2'-O)-methyltransferase